MDVDRVLEKCLRDQWKVDDLDWSMPPRPMSRDDEEAVVQYFVDMSAFERLAKALFEEQRKRVKDPRLVKIYTTFVADEERHAVVAERLARHYDVHRYRAYEVSREITLFTPHFLNAIKYLSDEIANAYVTGGELVLDMALLRSLNDYVNDGMSKQAMELVNRDESRHIAVDYHMVEYYTSDEYWEAKARAPRRPLPHHLLAAWSFMNLIYRGGPFFTERFVKPMQRMDPTGKRLREAFKRVQLLTAMPGMDRSPIAKFTLVMRGAYNHPVWGWIIGGMARRVMRMPHDLMADLYTDEEASRARLRGFDWLAQDALAAKHVG